MSILQKIPGLKLQWLALILLTIYPIAIGASRLGIWHFKHSFLLFVVAAITGFIVLVLSVLKMSRGESGESKALVIAVVASLLPLGVLGNSVLKAKNAPFIHDISTDLQTPPELMAAANDRIAGDHPVAYEGEALAKLQMAGYPDLKPLLLPKAPAMVFELANRAVADNGWQVLAQNNTTEPFTIEAVASSALFGFKDDIVIRIKALDPQQTQVDVRSMSRQGKSDLGVNAKRIKDLLQQIQTY